MIAFINVPLRMARWMGLRLLSQWLQFESLPVLLEKETALSKPSKCWVFAEGTPDGSYIVQSFGGTQGERLES
jgi:hypothetical protein